MRCIHDFSTMLWKLWHPKPNLPEYSIFRSWGATAPLYRIERLSSLDASKGGTIAGKKWVARYVILHDTALTAQAPWDKAKAINSFPDEESAAAALDRLMTLKKNEAANLATKLKVGPVMAYNATKQRLERWDEDVVYVSCVYN